MAPVAPLTLSDRWAVREITLRDGTVAEAFAPLAQHAAAADVVVVHRDGGEAVVLLAQPFWRRVLATIAVADGAAVQPKFRVYQKAAE